MNIALIILFALCAWGEWRVYRSRSEGVFLAWNQKWVEWLLGAGTATFAGTFWNADDVMRPTEHAHEDVHRVAELKFGFTLHKVLWLGEAFIHFCRHGLARDRITGKTSVGTEITIRRYRWYMRIREEIRANANEKNAAKYELLRKAL